LFLDEIGYMPMGCQVKLLRAVEHRQILPVGSTEPVDIDSRLIAATNRDLLEEIKEGRFREDLYYSVLSICIFGFIHLSCQKRDCIIAIYVL